MKECSRDGCKNEVTSKDKRTKYCSSSCSAKVSNHNRRLIRKYECNVCGAETTAGRVRCDDHRYYTVRPKSTITKEEKASRERDRLKRVYPLMKKKCLEYLGSKCVKCGSESSLEFDHVEPKDKCYTITDRIAYYSWEKLLIELDKCQLLCNKCHLSKTVESLSVEHGAGASGKKNCKCTPCKMKKREYQRTNYRKIDGKLVRNN